MAAQKGVKTIITKAGSTVDLGLFLVWMYFHPTTVPSSYVDFVTICTEHRV